MEIFAGSTTIIDAQNHALRSINHASANRRKPFCQKSMTDKSPCRVNKGKQKSIFVVNIIEHINELFYFLVLENLRIC